MLHLIKENLEVHGRRKSWEEVIKECNFSIYDFEQKYSLLDLKKGEIIVLVLPVKVGEKYETQYAVLKIVDIGLWPNGGRKISFTLLNGQGNKDVLYHLRGVSLLKDKQGIYVDGLRNNRSWNFEVEYPDGEMLDFSTPPVAKFLVLKEKGDKFEVKNPSDKWLESY